MYRRGFTTDRIRTLLWQITYLMEELILVEETEDFSRVLMRSAKPDKRAEGIYYYELMLEQGEAIRLDRRCYNFETRRRIAVPFTISKEIFERLVADFEEVLGKGEAHATELPPRFEAPPSIWETAY